MQRNVHAFLNTAMVVAMSASTAGAQSVEEFYKNSKISVSVGYAPGGGNDAYARLVSRHFGRYMPGKPGIVVQNMPGAGGLKHMNYMYNVAPKDGSAIGATNQFTAFQPLFKGKSSKIKYDPRNFQWLGSPVAYTGVAIAWHTSGIKSGEDLLKKELVIGASGVSSSSVNVATGLKNLLGFKYKIILGYPGGADIDLAIARGEVQGRSNINWDSLMTRHADWVKNKKVNIIYQMGLKKNPIVPADVPLILDYANTKEQREVLELMFASYGVGYPFLAPPTTPKDRVAAIRNAFVKAYGDPKLLREAERWRIAPVTGEELHAIIDKAYAAKPEVIARMRAAYKKTAKFTRAKPKVVRTQLLTVKKKGKAITFKDASGKTLTVKLSGRRTKITIAGKKAKRSKVKVGMTCEISYFGNKGRAKKLNCE
jgi:tripartite-type tricarboxylate transporter receptor subunit TctC